MTILTRVFLYYILISISVFLVTGFVFYYSFKKEVYEEFDEQLRDEKRNIERFINENDSIPFFFSNVNFSVDIKKTNPGYVISKIQRKDTTIIDAYEGEILSRQWRYTAQSVSGKNYIVTLRKSMIDLEDLLEQIISSFGYALLGFIVLSSIVNYFILRKTFYPFRLLLNRLRNFSINEKLDTALVNTNIQEFNELNAVLLSMTRRIANDYNNIKEFSENASHEIQTPLAIIKNKLELLMQEEGITQKQADLISSSYHAVSRLSKLNESLILLTRIENGEFKSQEDIKVNDVLRALLSEMSEQFNLKDIKIEFKEAEVLYIKMNRVLAEILFSNLLVNSIRHNHIGGKVLVEISSNSVSFSNTGNPLDLNEVDVFQRFVHSSNVAGSLGIGLSLVKKITSAFLLEVSYSYRNGYHTVTIFK
jgi:signal transduction histidine kinase